jgi:ribosomal protein L34E
MNKALRLKIKEKFDGKCAYCGRPLQGIFHIDHIKPIFRGRTEDQRPERAGEDIVDNLFPACPRCNRAKSTMDIEKFRRWIKRCCFQLFRDEPKYRLLRDYGMIQESKGEVIFYFERKGGEAQP